MTDEVLDYPKVLGNYKRCWHMAGLYADTINIIPLYARWYGSFSSQIAATLYMAAGGKLGLTHSASQSI